MRKVILLSTLLITGCLIPNTPVAIARTTYPEHYYDCTAISGKNICLYIYSVELMTDGDFTSPPSSPITVSFVNKVDIRVNNGPWREVDEKGLLVVEVRKNSTIHLETKAPFYFFNQDQTFKVKGGPSKAMLILKRNPHVTH